MDTLDVAATKTAGIIGTPETLNDALTRAEDKIDETVDAAADKAKEVAQKINWSKVAGYAAAGLAVAAAIGGYAYWQNQKQPETRVARLKRNLGLAHVDFKHLRSTLDQYDFDELDRSRRQLGDYAKKATHKGALKVAELTR